MKEFRYYQLVSLCYFSPLCLCVNSSHDSCNHRDTENTEEAQRFQLVTAACSSHSLPCRGTDYFKQESLFRQRNQKLGIANFKCL